MIEIADATGATNHGIGVVLANQKWENGVRISAVQPGQVRREARARRGWR